MEPTKPATRVNTMDSPRIIPSILLFFQPTAFRTPISLVRSKTDIIMVFTTPIPPITMAKIDMAQEAVSMVFKP